MKTNTGNKIRLGIFVSLGITLFIVGVYFIGERHQLFSSTFRVTGVFKDVAGLQAGNNVRFSGVNVGTIENISIVNDSSVRVETVIDESARKFMKKDAVASIGSEGLMGNKILIISPGVGGKAGLEDNDTLTTVQPTNLDELLLSLKTTIDNTSQITGDLSKISSNVKSGKGAIGKLFMDRSTERNIDSTISNLRKGSVAFKVLMDKAKSSWLLWGF